MKRPPDATVEMRCTCGALVAFVRQIDGRRHLTVQDMKARPLNEDGAMVGSNRDIFERGFVVAGNRFLNAGSVVDTTRTCATYCHRCRVQLGIASSQTKPLRLQRRVVILEEVLPMPWRNPLPRI